MKKDLSDLVLSDLNYVLPEDDVYRVNIVVYHFADNYSDEIVDSFEWFRGKKYLYDNFPIITFEIGILDHQFCRQFGIRRRNESKDRNQR